MSPLDSDQRNRVSRTTIVKPDKRYDEIMKIVNQRKFQSDPYLKALNINVDTSEMLKIKGKLGFSSRLDFYFVCLARILPPPQVKYRGKGNSEAAEEVAVGKWTIRNRFFASPPINKWGIIYFGPKPDNNIILILQEFENQLPSVNYYHFSLILMSCIEYFS